MGWLTGKKVIVPYDFSEFSLQALEKTLQVVSDPALIEVVCVLEEPLSADPGMFWDALSRQAVHDGAKAGFEKLAKSRPEFSKATFVSLMGDPGTEIVKRAKEQGAELIVISSHGRTGLARFMIGSVAERVVRLAACPVLVLKPAVPAG
jgi:nucleotide-binding universal stress UspA family protein